MRTVDLPSPRRGRCPHLPGRAQLGFPDVRWIQPAFPGFPSDRLRFPRLQLRGSAGFSPASLLVRMTRMREPKKLWKSRLNIVPKIYSLTPVKSIGTRWRRCGAGALARGFWLWSSLSGKSVSQPWKPC